MTASLTTLIAKVQAALLDDGTRYTTATCTAAIRQALKEFNDMAPRLLAETLATVAEQHEYELTGGDFDDVIDVLSVFLVDDDGDDDTPIDYVDFTEDNRVFIKLKEAQAASENLLIGFTAPNIINGLDSQVESTIPDVFDQVLVDGGAYYAICIRSAGRVEPINLNRDVSKTLRDTAIAYKTAFEAGKMKAAGRKPRAAKTDPTWAFSPTEY